MATAFLNRSHAVIWCPPRSVGERAFAAEPCLVVMRATGQADQGARYARISLDALPKLKSVSIVFDARDVTVLAATLPSLSAAKLQRALPNIVEESILQDATSCAFAPGPVRPDGKRIVALIDKAWLEFVVGAFERRGMWVTAAWPAQLCIPFTPGRWSMACLHDGIAVRAGLYDGFGWGASGDPDFRTEAIVSSVQTAQAAGVRGEPVIFAEDPSWRSSVERAMQRAGISYKLLGLPVPKSAPVDLLDGRTSSMGKRWFANFDWRAWRVPAMLAGACVAAFLVGLNLHWGKLAAEKAEVKAQLERKFRQTFPNAKVVVDPALQMQRQLATLRQASGQPGPDDLVPLVSRFGQALGARAIDALTSIEYRGGKLKVRFTPSFVESRAMRESLRDACQRAGLLLTFEGEREPVATVAVRT